MHGDVVEDKMGGWDESVMMVSSNQKKVFRDLPTVGVRIKNSRESHLGEVDDGAQGPRRGHQVADYGLNMEDAV